MALTPNNMGGVETLNAHAQYWFTEGWGEGTTAKNLLYTEVANIRQIRNPNDFIQTMTGGEFYSRHGMQESARTFEMGPGWRIQPRAHLYKSAFEVNEKVRDYAEHRRVVEAHMRALGAYGVLSIDALFVNVLNNAFNAAFPVYDGQPLASLTHPLRNAPGVFANRPVTGSPLTQASYKEAVSYFYDQRNDDGLSMSLTPEFIIVHPSKYADALITMATTVDPNSQNDGTPSAVVALRGMGTPRILTSGRLTNPNAWFVLAGRSDIQGMGHGLDLWFTPTGMPKTRTVIKQDPWATKYVGEFEVAPLVTKVRGVWANPGA